MDKNIFLWDVYGECQNYALLQGHKNAVLEVSWNFDGTELYSVGADKMVCVWDAAVCLFSSSSQLVWSTKTQTQGSHIVRKRRRWFQAR